MRIELAIVCALMGLSVVEAAGLDNLKAKLRHKYSGANGARRPATTDYANYGGGVTDTSGYDNPNYAGYRGPAYRAEFDDTIYGRSNPYGTTPVMPTPHHQRYGAYPAHHTNHYANHANYPNHVNHAHNGGSGASAAASAAASATSGGVASPAPIRPVRPFVNTNTYRTENLGHNHVHPVHANRFPLRRPAVHGGGGAASAAASASASAGGASSAASAATGGVAHGVNHGVNHGLNHGVHHGGHYGGHHGGHHRNGFHGGALDGAASQVHSSSIGTYSNNDNGRESSSYKRSTENVQQHENGHEDDNHYYNAQSYGKAEDEDLHEAFNKNDEDITQTPTLYKSKKSGENYVMDYKKARHESGSGVLAKDKHSSAFNKNSNRLIENVDEGHSRFGDGIVEDVNRVSALNLDDEDEEIFDSDGFGHQHVKHHPVGTGGGAAAASAAAGSVSSSAAAAGSAGTL